MYILISFICHIPYKFICADSHAPTAFSAASHRWRGANSFQLIRYMGIIFSVIFFSCNIWRTDLRNAHVVNYYTNIHS